MRRRRGALLLGLVAGAATVLSGCASGPGAGAAPRAIAIDTAPTSLPPASGGPAASPTTTGTPSSSAASPQDDVTVTAAPPAGAAPKAGPAPVKVTVLVRASTGPKAAPAKASPKPGPNPAPSSSGGVLGAAGNPDGRAGVPADGRAVDTSRPTRVIGTGTRASCTSAAVVAAVAAGGIVTFDCGPAPVTIVLTATAKVVNTHPDLVLDGGGTVTLSGGGTRRILYQNACDAAQQFTTAHCDDQETPRLVVQNLRLVDGSSTADREGGGAIFVRGGRLRVVNSRFEQNRCAAAGSDLGGAAIRVFDQSRDRPVYVVGSTFTGGACANGGALSSIGVSWVVLNSLFTGNAATGTGASSGNGGNGGAIYLDGNAMTLTVRGTRIEGNTANAGGGAIFFVSNDRTGTMAVDASTLRRNPSRSFETAGLPGIFFLGARAPTITASTLS